MTASIRPRIHVSGDDRFFVVTSLWMAGLILVAFSMQFAMGRSTFHAPLPVHLHAMVFMGWVGIYVAQTLLATNGNRSLHRRLGWIGAGWIVPMVVMGILATVMMVRRGQAPFFFPPVQFLILNPVSVLTFAGLTWAAVAMRRQTGWHRRLHYCGMANLLGPAFGRLLPMPLLIPWAFEVTALCVLLFPLAGIVADRRRNRSIHPAWIWGTGVILLSIVSVEVLSYGPAGRAIYRAVTSGTPGETVNPYAFPPPPQAPLVTGR
ncbi:hypothetical protein ABC347_03730 [Sphingomonas sp. 1P06PA]|uniref:hypothetical protein n=1 Tax=Sphingomonas sp. 1P06PA TaxID=554121 RepID=UPI0039A44E3E